MAELMAVFVGLMQNLRAALLCQAHFSQPCQLFGRLCLDLVTPTAAFMASSEGFSAGGPDWGCSFFDFSGEFPAAPELWSGVEFEEGEPPSSGSNWTF